MVADNKEVGSFVPRQSHTTIFFEKQCFIQESGNSFRDETAGSVDLVSSLFRVIKKEGLKEQHCNITAY